jgi:hypothetical protein
LSEVCGRHAFFPVAIGTYRRYEMQVPTGRGELALELVDVADHDSERVAVWSVSLGLLDAAPLTSRLERRCDDTGAEEPWFGYGMSSLLRFEGQTWRWPSVLRDGLEFGGTVDGVAGSLRRELTREHRVISRESITVPAGTFSAWRIEVVDRGPNAPTGAPGTWWVAEHVGLIRSVQVVDSTTTLVQELVERRDPTSDAP